MNIWCSIDLSSLTHSLTQSRHCHGTKLMDATTETEAMLSQYVRRFPDTCSLISADVIG